MCNSHTVRKSGLFINEVALWVNFFLMIAMSVLIGQDMIQNSTSCINFVNVPAISWELP